MKEAKPKISATRRRWVASLLCAIALLIVMTLFIAMFGGLIPTPLGIEIDGIAAFGGGLSAAVGFTVLVLKDLPPTTIREWLTTRLLTIISSGLIAGLFVFMIVGISLPWIYTEIFGQPGERSVTVSHWRTAGRLGCEGPNFVESSFFPSVCLNDTWKAKLPPGSELVLLGKNSPFGTNVTAVKLN